MKLSTSHSALKNKLFLGFWFILFAGTILFVDRIFRLPEHKAQGIQNRMADIEKHITRLTALHAEFLLRNDKEDNLFVNAGSNAETEIKKLTGSIHNNVMELKSINLIAKKAGSNLDEFSGAVSDIEVQISNLILITRERGNKNSGIVNQWLNLSRNMLTASANSAEIQRSLNQIKLLESEYLLNRNVRALQDISVLVEDIRNSLSMGFDAISVTDIDAYIVLTGNLVSIEKRMGHHDGEGIVPDLEKSVQELPVLFTSLESRVDKLIKNNLTFWSIVHWINVLLLVTFFIYTFIRHFALIDPLKKLAAYASRLSLGELPEEKLIMGNHVDMKVAVESLYKHVQSIKEKVSFTKALNEDKLDHSLTLAGENDLLGSELLQLQKKILENNQKQARNEEENAIRRYMNEGVAKFADILRTTSNDIQLLGDTFIKEMVKYLNAVQGGLFIYDDSDMAEPVLNLLSSFAYNRKKYLQKSVKIGEGLVGSCAREKLFVHLTEIPDGYISITSGLGDTPPRNLLLIPVLHDNEILGVVEIASMKTFKKHEIDFVQEVANSLGSTLVTTRNNQRTSELLEKSQQQALEMAEQEEEMRQNMEELKATQEESARREEELTGFTEAAHRSLMVIEYNLEGRIHDVNENVCLFFGRDKDELSGKLHHEAFGGSLNTDIAFWNELQQKGSLSVSETIKVGKKTYLIDEHFARVTNRANATVKYINFVTNGRIGNS